MSKSHIPVALVFTAGIMSFLAICVVVVAIWLP